MSWSAPGTVPQPAPVLAVSAQPITAANPGRLIKLPDPKPLDVTQRYGEAASVSFTDTLNGQTTYHYHVQLKALKPGTRYYYRVTDGASEPSTAGLVVRDRAVRPGEVPVLQLRRPGHAVLGPQHLGQHLARVLRQLLVRGHRDREPGRREGRAAVPPAQRRPVLRQPGRRQRAGRVAGLRQQRRAQCGAPALDARPRQPRGRVRHRHDLRPPRPRPGRDRGAGRGRELLEWPVRLRPLPEPVPAARQRRHQLGRQPAARQLLRLPGRHREVHLARRRRHHLPGRRRQLRDRHGEHRAGDDHHRRQHPERHAPPTPASTPAASRTTRRTTRWSPTTRAASPTCRRSGWTRRWPRPATTRRWT